jgi:UDP-glucose 4-epimerase
MKGGLLVTGGLGYLGGRVAQALARQTGLPVRLGTRQPSREPPAGLSACERILFDLESPSTLAACCRDIHTVIHLAALNEIDCARDPERAVQVNVAGTVRLLDCAIRAGVRRFLYVSTAHVYAAPLVGRFTEDSPTQPVQPYAITHKAAEDFVRAAGQTQPLTSLVFRLANGFGAPAGPAVSRWSLLVNDLCRQAATSRRLVLKSPGLQPRNFITLTDVARAVIHFLQLEPATLGDGLFNIGGRQSWSILEMTQLVAERCERVLGYRPAIERPDSPAPSESLRLDYCVDKAGAVGFWPKDDYATEIDATLRVCGDWFGPA